MITSVDAEAEKQHEQKGNELKRSRVVGGSVRGPVKCLSHRHHGLQSTQLRLSTGIAQDLYSNTDGTGPDPAEPPMNSYTSAVVISARRCH